MFLDFGHVKTRWPIFQHASDAKPITSSSLSLWQLPSVRSRFPVLMLKHHSKQPVIIHDYRVFAYTEQVFPTAGVFAAPPLKTFGSQVTNDSEPPGRPILAGEKDVVSWLPAATHLELALHHWRQACAEHFPVFFQVTHKLLGNPACLASGAVRWCLAFRMWWRWWRASRDRGHKRCRHRWLQG